MIIGIIGCGAIGTDVALAADEMEEIEEIYLYDKARDAEEKLAKKLRKGKRAKDIDELIEKSDVVFETASQEAVKEYGEKILKAKKDMVIMSMGALFDDDFREKLIDTAKKNRCKIYLPSGA
ncbi:MAG: NAD(P)-binding domain-containing protein, partial [Thermoplasmata archaeon]|nr:NAD(P)-binding domain-containing protein [Thermoplasmata archaeon]